MPDSNRQRAVIIGAGPAGLTAAFELVTRSAVRPVVLEKSNDIGGISKTVNYKGNRIDIGGHRFFSKSSRVMEWWLRMLPLQVTGGGAVLPFDAVVKLDVGGADTGRDPAKDDDVMLLRARKSRIYFLRRFFEYPISLSADTLVKLGVMRTARIAATYLRRAVFPLEREDTLEQFFINRFGDELYRTFFKSYTEKVWGVPCAEISAQWGGQRIKGLSVWSTLLHAARRVIGRRGTDIAQKKTETSLIEQFLYPKFGPGQMWEHVAKRVEEQGGEVLTGWSVDRIVTDGRRVVALEAVETATGRRETFRGDYFFSTAPVRDLIRAFDVAPPANVVEVSDGLVYRDFITVGLLVRSLLIKEDTLLGTRPVSDNWIYIQEPGVLLGRLQIFNNWSPFMVAARDTVWLGLEYFCNESDELWRMPDDEIVALATGELSQIGIVERSAVLDATVLRVEKTYPAYFGTYERFAEIRAHVDRYENLFLIGRNGMHRYNNQDHSMLTAMVAVDNILAGRTDKDGLWAVNTETDYHEKAVTSK